MSDKTEGFRGRSIEEVQSGIFLRELPLRKGRYRYPRSGLSAEPGTLVLFQYRARGIASAVFLRDEKFDPPKNSHAGELHFDPTSFRTFEPLDVEAMQKLWPRFRAFGHIKQFLNPTLYPQFKKRLKHLALPNA
jgi:hypothetical protein